nr:radical SAM protein [Candidatus Sigynarchaeota archaeon]
MNEPASSTIARIRSKGALEARAILEGLSAPGFEAFLRETRRLTDEKFGKRLKCYVPGNDFPAMSVTGDACELRCKHCNERYLHGMIPAETPEKLEKALRGVQASGGSGALISGGSTKDGIVDTRAFLGVLERVKHDTALQLNMHTGLIDEATARRLHVTGVDTISLDLVGDDATIRDIYGLNKTVADYKRVLRGLMDAGFTNRQIIPHVCIGLNKGTIQGEYNVLDYVSILNPRLIVFIVLIPPKSATVPGSSDGFVNVPPVEVSRLIATTRSMFPAAELSIGCMRPGGKVRNEYDVAAFKAGITRIALPTRNLLKMVETLGYGIEYAKNCCAMGSMH